MKSCFAAGSPSRQSAPTTGVSRKPVTAKPSRLNLTRDKGDDPPARNKADAAPAAKATPRRPCAMLAIYAGPDAPDEFEPIDDTRHCSLFELSEARCRWPISTPGAADFCFCGNTPLDTLP